MTASQTIGSASTPVLSVTVASGTTAVPTAPTGTVVFYDATNSVALGTASLSSGVAAITLAPGTLAVGSHLIQAQYSGDTVFAPVADSEITLTVKQSVTVSLTSNLTIVPFGQPGVLTATVTPITAAPGEANPTGTVLFYVGANLIGSSALTNGIGDSAIAVLTTNSVPAGYDTVTAVYQGDAFYIMTASNSLALDVQDFTIAPSPANPATNLNIVRGGSGAASFIIAGEGGFNNLVQVVCAVPSQDNMTCLASPQQVVPTGTVTFTVRTFTSGGPTSTAGLNLPRGPMLPRAAGGAALAGLVFVLLPFGRRARIFARRANRRFWILLLLLAGVGTAGMGCSSVASVTNNSVSTGTPLGVATLTITASAYVDNTVVSHSVYLTVNVEAQGSTTP